MPQWQQPGKCEKCNGSGKFWRRGPIGSDGKPRYIPDTCYPCGGKGHMTAQDVERTTYYYAHIYRVPSM